jgi:hypothetical protein
VRVGMTLVFNTGSRLEEIARVYAGSNEPANRPKLGSKSSGSVLQRFANSSCPVCTHIHSLLRTDSMNRSDSGM